MQTDILAAELQGCQQHASTAEGSQQGRVAEVSAGSYLSVGQVCRELSVGQYYRGRMYGSIAEVQYRVELYEAVSWAVLQGAEG